MTAARTATIRPTVPEASQPRLTWRQRVGLAIVGAGTLIQWAAISHHLAAA